MHTLLEEFENTTEMVINDLVHFGLKVFERVIKIIYVNSTYFCNDIDFVIILYLMFIFLFLVTLKLEYESYTKITILLHMHTRIVAHASNIY